MLSMDVRGVLDCCQGLSVCDNNIWRLLQGENIPQTADILGRSQELRVYTSNVCRRVWDPNIVFIICVDVQNVP